MSDAETVLITGASSGIGEALAQVFARHGFRLILLARSRDKLNELKFQFEKEHAIKVHVIVDDLAVPTTPLKIYQNLLAERITVDILINNAGFGDYGLFWKRDWTITGDLIQVNIAALTHLTRLFLPAMVERKKGRIMNVASIAAFQAGPLMSVYFASKAYVLSFTEALAAELKGSGVSVTALCPGPVSTGFRTRAGILPMKWIARTNRLSAAAVALYGYRALMKGEILAVPGIMNKLGVLFVKIIPRPIVRRLVGFLQKGRKNPYTL